MTTNNTTVAQVLNGKNVLVTTNPAGEIVSTISQDQLNAQKANALNAQTQDAESSVKSAAQAKARVDAIDAQLALFV